VSWQKSLAKSSSIQLSYGLKYVGPAFPHVPVKETTTSTCAIFVVCKNKDDLDTNLRELDGYLNANGKGEIADTVVASPNVERLDIFASKVTAGSPTVGARVLMEARSEHVADVKAFLNSTLPKDESNTLQWFAFQVEGTNVLGITGYFADEPSRNARLGGEATKAMFAKGKEWFVALPDAVRVDVLGQ